MPPKTRPAPHNVANCSCLPSVSAYSNLTSTLRARGGAAPRPMAYAAAATRSGGYGHLLRAVAAQLIDDRLNGTLEIDILDGVVCVLQTVGHSVRQVATD